MGKRRGFILKEICLYLLLGSILLTVALDLFRTAWQTYRTVRRIHQVKGDFLIVSERIKYDLMRGVYEITIGSSDFTMLFPAWAANQTDFAIREYTVMMQGSRLIYNIYHDGAYTATYLSSLVKTFSVSAEADLMILTFDYGDYQFQRSYRLDHIQTQRILYGFTAPDLSQFHPGERHPDHDSEDGPEQQCHCRHRWAGRDRPSRSAPAGSLTAG